MLYRDHVRSVRGSRKRWLALALVPLTVVGIGLSTVGPSVASNAPRGTDAAALPAGAFVPGQVLVRFASGTTPASAAAVNTAMGATTAKSFSYLVPNLQLVQLPAGLSVSNALTQYAKQASVEYVQPNYVSHLDSTKTDSITKTPNDPQYSQQWDWPKIDAPTAWNKSTGSHKVVVTDIDTGMEYTHDDLAANAWHNTKECDGKKGKDDDGNGYVDDCYGIDTINGDTDPMDDNGHGTHTAGTIGAVGDNKVGVTGMNWNVQVMPCKSHNASGSGSVSSIIECFQYVKMEKVKFGYDIIATNNSYGSCPEACDFNPATYDAIAGLIRPGVVMAFAAGNSARDNDQQANFPSNYDLPNIIAVAATDSADNMAGFSQYGLRSVDVGAPGVNVLSTSLNNGYASLSGTSMATPHVAGLTALLHAWNPKLDWWSIRNLIISGGDKISALDGKTVSGRRINAAGSMDCSGQKVFGLLNPVVNIGSMRQTVEALNINCAKPAGDLSVKVTPGNAKLALKDDGKGADIIAGDGIYTGGWMAACDPGKYTYTFSNGEKYTVNVVACIDLDTRSGQAGSSVKITGTGYGASEIVDVFWDKQMIDTIDASATGKISDTIKVPKVHAGKHVITVSGQTSGLTSAVKFRVR